MPTTPRKAEPLPPADASVAQWRTRATEMFADTSPFNATHHPSLALPCGTSTPSP
ncbi:hypothetical protein [Streptomyces sp. RPT161]|uniref:hypothetical protein n=1 Tax=Streptomyces sp. RPT161 TaxID=3015993 RepID=UPI0022B8B445|nr:hypothetical protein [Streptomyces sp. RPT161]